MAFDVTPTSGEEPYTFTAAFLNTQSFNHGYILRFTRSGTNTQSCPAPESATINVPGGASLLTEGVYVGSFEVPPGSCITYKLEVMDALGGVVDMRFVNISNIV